jgi:hypothetical protein
MDMKRLLHFWVRRSGEGIGLLLVLIALLVAWWRAAY